MPSSWAWILATSAFRSIWRTTFTCRTGGESLPFHWPLVPAISPWPWCVFVANERRRSRCWYLLFVLLSLWHSVCWVHGSGFMPLYVCSRLWWHQLGLSSQDQDVQPNNAFERPVRASTSARGQRVSDCAPSARLIALRPAAQRER